MKLPDNLSPVRELRSPQFGMNFFLQGILTIRL